MNKIVPGKILTTFAILLLIIGCLWDGNYNTTPIKHLVVIFQENVSFDHYFATYPLSSNDPGDPYVQPKENTPSVNGLSGALMVDKPNSVKPFRIPRENASTTLGFKKHTMED